MARVAILEKDQVSAALKDRFEKIEAAGRPVLNIFKVMAQCPKVGMDCLRLGNSILTKGSLDPQLRELAILRVGALAKANYEWTQHVRVGLRVGLPQEKIDAIPDWQPATLFHENERAVLQYTDEVARDIRSSDQTFGALKAFLNEEQIVELTITIGYYGMICRVLESLEVELENNLQ